jgi:hypothetical protein
MSYGDDVAAPMTEPRPTVDEQLAEILEILRGIRDRPSRQYPAGALHPRALLTEAQVLEARALSKAGLTVNEIRTRLSLPTTQSATHAAVSGRSWRHLKITPEPKGKA